MPFTHIYNYLFSLYACPPYVPLVYLYRNIRYIYMKKTGIYKITSPSNKIYIGQSLDEVELMRNMGYHRVWDCGVTRFEMVI